MGSERSSRLAVVTGASGGLGLELARLLAADGYAVMLVARSAQKLQQVAEELSQQFSVDAIPVVADLTLPGAAQAVAAAAASDGRPLDVLINNAGVGTYGPFVEQPLDRILALLQLNMIALTELSHRLLPLMLTKQRGYVMNVSSTAAFQPGPLMAVYYASKAYVLHLSEAIGEELRSQGIVVSAFCPGPTATGFEASAQMEGSKLFAAHRVMSAEHAAKIGYRGMWDGKAVVIPGFTNRFFAWATRLPPRSWLPKVARWMQEPKSSDRE